MITNFNQTISQFIESQFPALYREEGEVLVTFVTAYYEYLEETGLLNRKMFTLRDIDETFDDFVIFFRRKYLDGFPFVSATDDRFLVKNIIDFYRSKGSEESLKLLMKLLFDEEIEVYYPRLDILRASDSRWVIPRYLELTPSQRTVSFIGKQVTGSRSGATAFVEGIVSKRINGRLIDLLFISDLRGNFTLGDLITDDGNLLNSPTMVGSLSSVDNIETTASGYSIGQKLSVISPNGRDAIARITNVFTSSDRVNIELLEGGFGYTTDADTRVYVSNDVVFCENEAQSFIDFEFVSQSLETINSPSGVIQLGAVATGVDSSNTVIAEGRVVAFTANTVTVELESGSFTPQFTLTLANTNVYGTGTILEVEKTATLDIVNVLGVFVEGEEVIQREIVNGISTNIATGVIDSILSADNISLENVFGRFEAELTITGKTSGATAVIETSNMAGFEGLLEIVATDGDVITVVPFTPKFDPLNPSDNIIDAIANFSTAALESREIKDVSSNRRNFITTAIDTEITIVIDGNSELVTTFTDSSAVGFVVGQNFENVGIAGNQNPFIFVSETPNFIRSTSSNQVKEIIRLGTGAGANFEILELENEETIDLGSELISDENIVSIPFLDVSLGGANTESGTKEMDSGVGRVAEFIIIDGGTGYANSSTVTLTGGGLGGSEPTFSAAASVVTDSNSSIISLTVTDPGEGYWETPTIEISDGSGANVEIVMDYGFGFEKLPYSNMGTVINDALDKKQSIIGTISAIGNISRGFNYDTNPYLRVVNPKIRSYNINNVWLTRGIQVGGTFALNEIVQASNGAKGKIIQFDQNRMLVKKLSFQSRFSAPDTLVGLTSGTTSDLLATEIQTSRLMGDNADFRTFVNLADGIIAEVEIFSSGYGYFNNEEVTLVDDTNTIAGTGIGRLQIQGKGLGYWETTTSQLNDKKLHDNKFYQEYSYQIRSALSFDRYEVIVRNLLHVAGMELFGKVAINTSVNTTKHIDTSISLGIPIFTTTDLIGDENVANVTYEVINVDATESGVGRLSTEVLIIDGGSGYTNTSTIDFIGGGETANDEPTITAEASVITDEFGAIAFIEVTNQGEGYWNVPEVVISDGEGANIELTIEYGYGFPKLVYSNLNTNLEDALSDGEILFDEQEVLF